MNTNVDIWMYQIQYYYSTYFLLVLQYDPTKPLLHSGDDTVESIHTIWHTRMKVNFTLKRNRIHAAPRETRRKRTQNGTDQQDAYTTLG